jgi:hypothetical protein
MNNLVQIEEEVTFATAPGVLLKKKDYLFC